MEHNHDHMYEHGCCCHSHEHHEHEHCGCGLSHEGIHVDIHDGALVGSLKRTSHEPFSLLKNRFQEETAALREWTLCQNGHIGHIKGFIKSGERICSFSTTGSEITISDNEKSTANEVELNIVCIVFGIEKEKLECRLADITF